MRARFSAALCGFTHAIGPAVFHRWFTEYEIRGIEVRDIDVLHHDSFVPHVDAA